MKIEKITRPNVNHERDDVPKPLQEPIPEEMPPPRKISHGFVSFPETMIAPGQVVVVSTLPQVPFKPLRLVVDQTDVPCELFLTRIKIGKNDCLFNAGAGACCTLFPPLPHNLTEAERVEFRELQRLDLEAVQISQFLTLELENRSKQAARFNAIMWGVAVD